MESARPDAMRLLSLAMALQVPLWEVNHSLPFCRNQKRNFVTVTFGASAPAAVIACNAALGKQLRAFLIHSDDFCFYFRNVYDGLHCSGLCSNCLKSHSDSLAAFVTQMVM
jgi:hypothetical protein